MGERGIELHRGSRTLVSSSSVRSRRYTPTLPSEKGNLNEIDEGDRGISIVGSGRKVSWNVVDMWPKRGKLSSAVRAEKTGKWVFDTSDLIAYA